MERLSTRWLRLPLYLLLLFYLGDNLVFSENGVIETKLLEEKKYRLAQNNLRLRQEIEHLQALDKTSIERLPSKGTSLKFIEIDNPVTGRSIKDIDQAKFSERQWYLFSTTFLLLLVTLFSFIGRSKNENRLG